MTNLKILEDTPLAPHTTFKIGGPAKYFFQAASRAEAQEAVKWAKENNLKYFILGGGSNLLVADRGFDGLVIKLQITNYKLKDNKILAEAGMNLAKLVQAAAENNLSGLEWAIGIPGTLGGAVRGNAGAMGHSMEENIEQVEVLTEKNTIEWRPRNKCQFKYRESAFRQNPRLIILSADIKLSPGNQETIRKQMQEYLERRKNQPRGFSAGSIFKNVELSGLDSNLSHKLLEKYPEIKDVVRGGKLSTGWLIERCDLSGRQIGQAQVSPKHANFIVNLGQATAEDVLILISLIKQKVRNKFGIQLQEEIEIV